MHAVRAIRHLQSVVRPRQIYLQTTSRSLSTTSPGSTPWFVDPDDAEPPAFARRPTPPHLPEEPYELPPGIPEPVRVLYNELSTSPYLEPSTLVAREPPQIPPGPPLPVRMPHGRRKRGGTYAGESMLDSSGGIWNWVVMAQVKEGTEHRGAIESVVRVVRKTLLNMKPPLPLPPNSKRRTHNGWAMVDAGNFAVHILSKEARQKYFENIETRTAEW